MKSVHDAPSCQFELRSHRRSTDFTPEDLLNASVRECNAPASVAIAVPPVTSSKVLIRQLLLLHCWQYANVTAARWTRGARAQQVEGLHARVLILRRNLAR